MNPYFYIIQHKQTKIYYAGCRFAKNCNPSELLTEGGYLTSSHVVNELIREEGIDAFVIRRIKTFSSADEALDYETRFLQKVDACNNPQFYNRSNNAGFSTLNQDARRSIMLERYGVENAMQIPGISQKASQSIKNNNMERYGVEYTCSLPHVQDKIKQTNLERYGVDNVFKSPEFQDKVKQTNLERYGVDNPFKSPEIQDKAKQTNLERYGFEYATQSEEVKDKIRQTNLDRYGVEYTLQLKDVQEKARKTCNEKYNTDYYTQTSEFKRRYKETCLMKYGADHFFKSEEGRKVLSEGQKGTKHHRFRGWYITPKGRFASLSEIRDKAPELGTVVNKWCNNSSKVISKRIYDYSSYLNTNYDSSIIGKTFKELGFSFEEV